MNRLLFVSDIYTRIDNSAARSGDVRDWQHLARLARSEQRGASKEESDGIQRIVDECDRRIKALREQAGEIA